MPQPITSLQNPRLKAAARLRDRRDRDEEGKILIDGAREVGRAAAAGVRLLEVYLCPAIVHTDEASQIVARLTQSDAEILELSEAAWSKIAYGDRSDGILAVAETPRRTLADLVLPASPLVAVAAGIEKPGNLGAICRSADAAGVSAMIVADGRTDLFNPNAIRASLGTIFSLPTCQASGDETLAWLRKNSLQIVAARVDADRWFTEIDWQQPTAIILGSEATGLDSAWSGPEVTPIALPMLGAADSLNVSTSAAVLFYEALRQRGFPERRN